MIDVNNKSGLKSLGIKVYEITLNVCNIRMPLLAGLHASVGHLLVKTDNVYGELDNKIRGYCCGDVITNLELFD